MLGRTLGTTLRTVLCGAALLIFFGPPHSARADNIPPTPDLQPPEEAVKTLLDGKVFVGEVGAVGKQAHLSDEWNFSDGIFWSRECIKCGYAPSPYTARRKGDTIHFETMGICEDNSARIVWKGTYKNGRIEGTMRWTKERWYWTIDKTFWFRARLDEGRTPRQNASSTADAVIYVNAERQ